jgi:pantothenate kinase
VNLPYSMVNLPYSIDALSARLCELHSDRGRLLLGICGEPGAGKSTLSHALASLAPHSVVVPMDGFHLDNAILEQRGLLHRKGAPETFDVDGFVSLLERIRRCDGETIFAPDFRREIDVVVGSAIAITPQHTTVVVEGNYLLLADNQWRGVRPLLDAIWFLDVDDGIRQQRVVKRHMESGLTADAAWIRASENDNRNAHLVRRSSALADAVIDMPDAPLTADTDGSGGAQ